MMKFLMLIIMSIVIVNCAGTNNEHLLIMDSTKSKIYTKNKEVPGMLFGSNTWKAKIIHVDDNYFPKDFWSGDQGVSEVYVSPGEHYVKLQVSSGNAFADVILKLNSIETNDYEIQWKLIDDGIVADIIAMPK